MGAVDDDAPPRPSPASACTMPLAAADDAVNALHDRLNAALPRLWWPLSVPSADRRLGLAEHALYAAHAGAGIVLASAVAPRRLRPPLVAVGVVAAFASWALFTGAWDRRADQPASAARRER